MTTPKMADMTPTPHATGSFGFSPALLGQSPAALLAKHRSSPIASATFNSPGTLAAFGVDLRAGVVNVAGNVSTPSQLPPDENKKRELAEILKLLASKPGRISVYAVERLAKRMGLDTYKDQASGTTTLSLAAKMFLLDIEFIGDKVEHVQLSFEKAAGLSGDLAAQAAAIFHKSLIPTPRVSDRMSLLVPSLYDFADNLSSLYRTDKLSTSLNCFNAITGIYQSLCKIYEYERDNMGGEIAALCFGNGRPRMHTRGKVGLSVDYWKERPSLGVETEEEQKPGYKLWRVLIEVEETPPDFGGINMNTFTAVRVSNEWVSDEIKKPREDHLFGDMEELITDWLEPPVEELMDVSGDPSQQRPPPARFVARLDPPVVLPLHDQLELQPSLIASGVGTLESVLFPGQTQNAAYRKLHVPHEASSDTEEHLVHRYVLHSHLKPVYARQVTKVPFSHPRELLPIFRTLRQYAVVGSLLESCFGGASQKMPFRKENGHVDPGLDVHDDLSSFLNDDHAGDSRSGEALPVDITLEPEHGFGLRVVFPTKSQSITNLQVQVGKNAELKVLLSPTEEGGNLDAKAVEKVLRACEDIGLMVEWLRRQQ
ncbi:mediator of RNA polymerase II transcription subunit 1-domain-containing protein [Sphaerosporella brunnea]|uniref:Mediator of RNA polymerase II transcription subunit 1 n=1 Tax=Sphaerosporella brunnea TaxID=1250544 RepID=A0A5J5EC63_9PEZI|nr:mediator of RNA polymerase II transcription subunit 1-domain-containing protein [Sphaerosporella brunnea]